MWSSRIGIKAPKSEPTAKLRRPSRRRPCFARQAAQFWPSRQRMKQRYLSASAFPFPCRAPARDGVDRAGSSASAAARPSRSPRPRRPPNPLLHPAPDKATLPAPIADGVARLTTAIEAAEKTIQHLTELEEELSRLRVDVECILSDSTDTAETLRPQLAAVRSQIEKLGPPPAKDAPPEAPAIAAERARLTALAAAIDGAIKIDRAHLGARAPADREDHGAAPLALHQEPGGAPAEPAAAGPVARPDERFPGRRPPDRLPGRGLAAVGRRQARAAHPAGAGRRAPVLRSAGTA